MRSSLIVASLVLGALASPRTLFSSVLDKRQTSPGSFPTQCTSQCNQVESALNSCSDDSCFCTSANIESFAACLQCTANLIGDVQELQSDLDEVTSDCNSEGFKVPTETLTGAAGGGTVPTDTVGGSTPTFSFAAPSATSDDGGSETNTLGTNPPAETTPTTPVTQPQTSQPSSGDGLPSLGGSGHSGALGMSVPQTLVAVVLGLAITAL